MLESAILGFANHLMASEGWALLRLKPYVGQLARFEVGPVVFSFAVDHDGSLHRSASGAAPQVTIRLPSDAPIRLLTNPGSVFQSSRIDGSVDFAEALGFVGKNLRWDAEADLARLIGDLPARRIHRQGLAILRSKREIAARLAANISEFVVDEEALVVRPLVISGFCNEIDRLRDDLARLEKRISRL